MSQVTMIDIKAATEEYADAARLVRNIKENMEAELSVVNKKYSTDLINASKKAGEAMQMVLTLLNAEGAANLFKTRKTLTINGVQVGYRKMKGSFVIPNEKSTIDLICEKLPGKAEILLTTDTSIVKKALNDLHVDELKKIGVSIESDTDEPVVKINDKDIQKLIDATVKESMAAVQ